MTQNERLNAFEEMLGEAQAEYESTVARMARLKSEGREKTVTFRQLMGVKLELTNLLSRYRRHGLLKEGAMEHGV